jgi:hypothetical protein
LALGLGLVAKDAFGEAVVAVPGAGDLDIAVAGELLAHGGEGVIVGVEGFVEAGGEDAGFEAGGVGSIGGELRGGGGILST